MKNGNPLYNKQFVTPLRGAVYELAPVEMEVTTTQSKENFCQPRFDQKSSDIVAYVDHPNCAKDEKRESSRNENLPQ